MEKYVYYVCALHIFRLCLYSAVTHCSSGPNCLSMDMQARQVKVSHHWFTNSASLPIRFWRNLAWTNQR